MIAVLKHAFINKLNKIDEKYNNTCHRTIKMKPALIKLDIFIDFGVEHNGKDPKFRVADHKRVSKYKTFLKKFTL